MAPPPCTPGVSNLRSRNDAWRLLCRFLDAGGIRPIRTLRRPASKKRQGAKSRAAGQRPGGERYGDFRLAAHSMEAGRWGDATWRLHAATGESVKEASRAGFEGCRRGPGAWTALNRVERNRRGRGTSAAERGCGGERKKSGS
jgi:hypothetical protein